MSGATVPSLVAVGGTAINVSSITPPLGGSMLWLLIADSDNAITAVQDNVEGAAGWQIVYNTTIAAIFFKRQCPSGITELTFTGSTGSFPYHGIYGLSHGNAVQLGLQSNSTRGAGLPHYHALLGSGITSRGDVYVASLCRFATNIGNAFTETPGWTNRPSWAFQGRTAQQDFAGRLFGERAPITVAQSNSSAGIMVTVR